jgi:hypothetical protein
LQTVVSLSSVSLLGQSDGSSDLFLSFSGNLFGDFLGRLSTLSHHIDFSVAVRVRLRQRLTDWICCSWETISWWSALPPMGFDPASPDSVDPCLSGASIMRPTRVAIVGRRSVPELEIRVPVSIDLQTYQRRKARIQEPTSS